jgi:hypothetical protein
MPRATSWSPMVLPIVLFAGGIDCVPSMLMVPGKPWLSLLKSIAGVAASVPVPVIGQIPFGLAGLSVDGTPVERLVAQDVLCHAG